MKLLSISIVRLRNSPDRVFIETDLPAETYPFNTHLDLSFTVAKGAAEDYCKRHFPDVPIKAIV